MRRFVELFDGGQFFASHEVLEARWLITRDPFQRALIILASAFVQRDRGNMRGCMRQLAKARRYLADHEGQHPGVDVHGLIAELHRCWAQLEQHPDAAAQARPPVLGSLLRD
ncbi:MAG: DUF309 domain-containing protein [Gammaproteobacteria bacterium]|nr:DUF309 domain-containing protein [Gammaproteobacteria bacterium]